jgi:hypothetical protein
MYPPIKAIYENGNVILQETPPTLQKTNVIIMFINDDIAKTSPPPKQGVKMGSLARQGYQIPNDFNQPLSNLSEYM